MTIFFSIQKELNVFFLYSVETGHCYVAQAGLEINHYITHLDSNSKILMPQPPKCLGYRHTTTMPILSGLNAKSTMTYIQSLQQTHFFLNLVFSYTFAFTL